MKTFVNFSSFPTVYHLRNSDKWVKYFVQNTFQSAWNDFCFLKIHNKKFKNLEKVTLQKCIGFFVAFQRYILCVITINDYESMIVLLHTDRRAVPTLRKRSTVMLCRSSTRSLSRAVRDYCRILFYHRL